MQSKEEFEMEEEKQEVKKESKKALKRKLKQQKWEENRKVRKMVRKTKPQKRNRIDYLKRFGKGVGSGISKQDMKKSFSELCQKGLKIYIDCGNFQELMNDKQKQSLYKQLELCYAFNKKCKRPASLIICNPGPVVTKKLEESHAEQWLGTTILNEPENAFLSKDKKELIYLSADTDNTLEALDPEKGYIIGGLVDRNRHKGVCASKAEKLEIEKAKLPVKENIKLSSSVVLTVNHVFQILLRAQEEQGKMRWEEAFEATLPSRKKEE